jgi:hypothetical protein
LELGKLAVEDKGVWTRVTRQRVRGAIRASTSEPAARIVKVYTAVGELGRKRKVEYENTQQVVQLQDLVYRLLESQEDQKTTRDSQQEQGLAAIEAQAKTIARLEATIQKQSEDLREIKTSLGPEQAASTLYSDALD